MTLSDWLMVNPFVLTIMIIVGVIIATALIIASLEGATGTVVGEWPGRMRFFLNKERGRTNGTAGDGPKTYY